ncbi:alpha/beta hydrolase [Agromyces soli]|uniref:Alpha/beta hydrolase n=1 Tax=Agromyces soli TaxID=659012 RepID=A0ABY4AY64_9MICO|nr:alpha/beta hydrolase [Agromyces soli]UOE27799.1 alpha/beta hydrolase [Agromyces soli]
MRRLLRILVSIVGVLALLAVLFLAYAHTVMQGERPAALAAWQDDAVTITSADAGIVIAPADPGTGPASGQGLVFIPGAKVDPYAYLFKLSGVVEETGLTVVITKPTLNLAFFDTRPLAAFTALAPDVDAWWVGGHSLGGVRACQLAGDADASGDAEVLGVMLFGSYCANDLSGSELAALSVSGSNDGLSTPAKIEAASGLLPPGAEFVELEGVNHADFGDYGVQPGDGESTVDDAEVRREIAEAVAAFSRSAGA